MIGGTASSKRFPAARDFQLLSTVNALVGLSGSPTFPARRAFKSSLKILLDFPPTASPHHFTTANPLTLEPSTLTPRVWYLVPPVHLRTSAAESTGLPPPQTHISSQRTACELLPTPQSWPTRDLRTSRRVSRACNSGAASQRTHMRRDARARPSAVMRLRATYTEY